MGRLKKISSYCIEKILQPETLFWVPLCALLFFLFLAIAYFYLICTGSALFSYELCFEPICIDNFRKAFFPVYNLLSTSLAFVAGLVAVLAAFTAVHTYQLSVKSNVLANHIAHFDMFREYLDGELNKLPRIDKKSVDVLKLFVFIFPRSREGEFTPSDNYVAFIDKIGYLIELTEGKYSGENSEVFYSFKEHQARVRVLLAECGIDVALKPNQTDFFRVEKEVYELLGKINECFCASRRIKSIPKPKYS